jgi:predicted MFS family arabinose efflux permease
VTQTRREEPTVLPGTVPAGRLRRRLARIAINGDFGRFWAGQALGEFAERSIVLLFPLIAVVSLHADTAAVGLLNAAQYAPVLLLSLYAGGWLAGRPRRRVLITTNLISALLLASVPIASGLGLLRMGMLYVVVFAIGAATSFGDVSTFSFTPELVEPDRLMSANSRLESTTSIATVAAPGLGGLLMGWFGGSTSLALCAAAYLVAALATASIRHRRAAPRRAGAGRTMATAVAVDAGTGTAPIRGSSGTLDRIRQGLRFTWRVPLLRTINLLAAWFNLFEQAVLTLYVVYAVRTLGFSAGLLGLTMTVGGVGPVLGPVLAGRMGRRLGAARTMVLTMALACIAPLLIPFAHGPKPWAFLLCSVAFAVYGFGLTVFNIFIVTAQQRSTPDALLPQVMATKRFAAYGTIGIGAAAGGVAGQWLGLRPALFGAVAALIVGWVAFSAALIRSGSTGEGGMHEVPEGAAEPRF